MALRLSRVVNLGYIILVTNPPPPPPLCRRRVGHFDDDGKNFSSGQGISGLSGWAWRPLQAGTGWAEGCGAPHTAPALGYHARSLSLSPSFSLSLSLSLSLARSLALSRSLARSPSLSLSLSQDCQEWYTSPTFITGQSRQGQPPLECSVSSHELPACVRGHMLMGMCARARA